MNGNPTLASREGRPYVAFGYHLAALRGEAPLVLRQTAIREWVNSRKWARQKKASVTIEQYDKWLEALVHFIMLFLEKAVVDDAAKTPEAKAGRAV